MSHFSNCIVDFLLHPVDNLLLLAADLPYRSIVAITGLDGHAYGSWTGKHKLGKMWLRHFLCKDLPSCRTMIYGYNSKLSIHGTDTVIDYSRKLIEELKMVRNTEEVRPCLMNGGTKEELWR